KELQNEAVSRLICEVQSKKIEITFKAPTGSGKTYMMADFMNRIIAENANVIFLVSSLSKGDLARQNYEKFCDYFERKFFANLNPYLINSEIAGEERLFIPETHNVYVLPRDLYKEKSRIKTQGVLLNFFLKLKFEGKLIFLIKDECHIATKNLDDLNSAFEKIINFSATPKLSRGQNPDIEITDEQAEGTKLIKTIEWGKCRQNGDETDETLEDAVNKFQNIKENYRNLLGVNPCLIIQISNKDKAIEEWNNTIKPVLDKNSDLKWMYIVDKDKDCDTNDMMKAKKLPVAKWKNYAKENLAGIDIIIFKMVITEGWDIPRACMLYQLRDSQSKQLDEQVTGRVRRNPCLLNFENLSPKAQELAMTAWVWGIKPESAKKAYGVKLYDEPSETTDNIKVKITKLKPLSQKADFDLQKILKPLTTHKSIFELGRKLKQASNETRAIIYDYAKDYQKWLNAAEFLDEIEKESNKYLCDYEQSMETAKDEKGNEIEVSFAITSHYTDNGNYVNIGNWVWKRRDGADKFSFDSEAEREWTSILQNLSENAIAKTKTGKRKKGEDLRQIKMFEEAASGGEKEIFLWGKNYAPNSSIKFEYYMGSLHSSFPDFIMKDAHGRVHIFEVKSVNVAPSMIDNNIYKAKIAELKKAYKQASKITRQVFYLPVLDGNTWQITQYADGQENTLTKEQFESFVKNL
ncbi:MAG: DEAD/DEAH box helicase family protein, partial [Elusimicrobiota bacterium]|nr:DEAD/DEAH box helicase family protein [Elusimicrobiota bacterium]